MEDEPLTAVVATAVSDGAPLEACVCLLSDCITKYATTMRPTMRAAATETDLRERRSDQDIPATPSSERGTSPHIHRVPHKNWGHDTYMRDEK